MPETTPLIKAALNLRVGAGFDVYGKRKETCSQSDGTVRFSDRQEPDCCETGERNTKNAGQTAWRNPRSVSAK